MELSYYQIFGLCKPICEIRRSIFITVWSVPRIDLQIIISRKDTLDTIFAYAILLMTILYLIRIYLIQYLAYLKYAEPVTDAQVWLNLGEAVMAGADLYSAAPDNKPPIWEGIAILAAATPWPYLVLVAVVGGSTIVLVLATYQLSIRIAGPTPAAIGALLVAIAVNALTHGFINNKATAMALFLLALASPRRRRSGVLYGCSFLVAQQVLLGAPAAVWWIYYHTDRQTVFQVTATAIATVVFGYLSVGIIWGIDALVAAFQQTILLAKNYTMETSQFRTNGSLITSFGQYYPYIIKRAKMIELLLFGWVVGLSRAINNRKKLDAGVWLAISLSVLFSTVLAIRIYRHYWIIPIPFYAMLCVYAIAGAKDQLSRVMVV